MHLAHEALLVQKKCVRVCVCICILNELYSRVGTKNKVLSTCVVQYEFDPVFAIHLTVSEDMVHTRGLCNPLFPVRFPPKEWLFDVLLH